jgi:alpha/beta superfamily hydrolase
MIIAAGDTNLEAALWEPIPGPPRGAALFCHPHPLYGGTMNNKVTYRSAKGALAAGLAALRFNFRGVGRSTGKYEKGVGERSDVAALLGWLQAKFPALPLALAGFSFGAWVGLQVGCQDPRVRALIGLGLPLNSYDFDFLIGNEKPCLIVIGTRDQFCPRDRMDELARRLPPSSAVAWIDEADHFFASRIDRVQVLVRDFLRRQFEEDRP